MIVDEMGLPTQRDGDRGDQLNRVGLLALLHDRWYIQLSKLRVSPGVYRRGINLSTNTVSGDQLVPVFGAALRRDSKEFNSMVMKTILRLGFAPNTHDTDGTRKFLPDFLLPRILPFMARAYLPGVLVCLTDLTLMVQVGFALLPFKTMDNQLKPVRKTGDDVDQDVNLVATLYACNMKRPTYFSKLAAREYEKKRPVSLGGAPNVEGALRWYHRADSGGNPEVGEVQVTMWRRALAVAQGRFRVIHGGLNVSSDLLYVHRPQESGRNDDPYTS